MFDKFRNIILIAGFVLTAIFRVEDVHAGDLIYDDSCMTVVTGQNQFSFAAADRFAGLSCQDIRQYKENLEMISIALMPVEFAMRSPQAQAMIAEELARLGLTLANPPVLMVTVLGAVGLTTVYFILRREMKDCEKEERKQLRDEILRDLKSSFGISPSRPPELVIQR